MAGLALHLKSHPNKPSSHSLLKSITFSLSFSSSSNNNNKNGSFSSYLNDIKSKLKHHSQNQHHQQQPQPSPSPDVDVGIGGDLSAKPNPFSTSLTDIKSKLKQHEQQSTGSSTSESNSTDEIRRNLSKFSRRSLPDFSSTNTIENRTEAVTFKSIRESLAQLRTSLSEKGKNNNNLMSFNSNISSFKAQPAMMNHGGAINVIGGGSALPLGVFGKEMKAKKDRVEEDQEEEEVWMRDYDVDELGKKLRKLRPTEAKGEKGGEGEWFSLSELNERLKKIREMDDLDAAGETGFAFMDLRKGIRTLKIDPKLKSDLVHLHGIDILAPGPPSFMLSPPKEHLVEKYFHPDNMSAEEKLKLELTKVRNEFKMHESDCGSARVQIAQLTTEILHLSHHLHKKDKHSRRGLQAKVQQRKKLLKYLRRTDWESYCFVLSKFGLRDNTEYKN